MAQSLIGETVHVCNCGPSCKCGYWSQQESACSCGRPTAERRILGEDAGGFYVSQTGAGAENCEELGESPFTASNGLPLQRFPVERDEHGEAAGMTHHGSPTAPSKAAATRATTGPTAPAGTHAISTGRVPSGREPSGREPSGATSGTVLGVAWSFRMEPGGRAMLRVGDREVHLEPDINGQWVTHVLAGQWPSPASIARTLLMFHPNYSPLARRREPPRVS